MKPNLSILMVAAEAHPLAKVGGLADVLGALPKALVGLGHDVRIALPHYKSIKSVKTRTEKVPGVDRVEITLGGVTRVFGVRKTRLPGAPVGVILLANDDLFGRDGIYTDPATGKDFPDNAERFVFFSRAALAAVEAMGWQPDVIHCHDYQTGFVPAWLKTADWPAGSLKGAGTVYTIHNLAYQGVYPGEVGRAAGFGEELLRPMGALEFYGNVNMMKAGIVFADTVTTVSPTYAKEIQTTEFGYGLEGVLRSRAADVRGILNGADYGVWDPAVDKLIPSKYSRDSMAGKAVCRRHLVERSGLKAEAGMPLVGMVSRMVDQKGFDIVMEAMDAIMGLGVNLVVLGTGEKRYQDSLSSYAKRFRGRISVNVGFDEELAHMIEAGCDMFLMPSKYEPCGLNQLYSMRYGTIPIVRRTGGLADSVWDYDGTERSTGFAFEDYSARALVGAVERAAKTFASRDLWQRLVDQAMAQDFSWERSARTYQETYAAMLDRKRAVSASEP
jgi:starch synthase